MVLRKRTTHPFLAHLHFTESMENARQQTEKQEKRNEIVDGECTRLPWRAIREKIGKERLLCKKKSGYQMKIPGFLRGLDDCSPHAWCPPCSLRGKVIPRKLPLKLKMTFFITRRVDRCPQDTKSSYSGAHGPAGDWAAMQAK